MSLKELIEKLKGFNCNALKNKEVAYCFSTKLGYTYKEIVKDVIYDAKNERFEIITGEAESTRADHSCVIMYENEKNNKKSNDANNEN